MVNALRAFFAMPVVNAVVAMLLALMLVTVTIARVIGLVRWLAGYEREDGDAFLDVCGGPSLVDGAEIGGWASVDGDVPGTNLEYEYATGDGFTWWPSTGAEQAALDPDLPEIYRGHDPVEFDAIQEASYAEFRARQGEGG